MNDRPVFEPAGPGMGELVLVNLSRIADEMGQVVALHREEADEHLAALARLAEMADMDGAAEYVRELRPQLAGAHAAAMYFNAYESGAYTLRTGFPTP